MVTDLAKDYDDLTALILLKELDRLNIITLIGVVANLVPAERRTRFGRGALDLLDLSHVPIATGTAGVLEHTDKKYDELGYEFDCSFMAAENDPRILHETGGKLLHRLCSQAVETGEKITLLLLSSLEDVHQFALTYPTLLKDAVSNIILQGGYSISTQGDLRPDLAAVNNRFNPESARWFHSFMKEYQIQSTVYTKVAAYATPLGSELFQEMAKTGHPLGEHLRKVQVTQDLEFYITASKEDPKERFAPFMDQTWFLKNKTNWFGEDRIAETPYPKGVEVIPYLTRLVVYDALAALGCSGQDTLDALNVLTRDNTQPPTIHRIVGSAEPGIFPDRMASALAALLKGSLLTSTCIQNIAPSEGGAESITSGRVG
jgi:inosine-uridine nucleoside N-ribohydrolase